MCKKRITKLFIWKLQSNVRQRDEECTQKKFPIDDRTVKQWWIGQIIYLKPSFKKQTNRRQSVWVTDRSAVWLRSPQSVPVSERWHTILGAIRCSFIRFEERFESLGQILNWVSLKIENTSSVRQFTNVLATSAEANALKTTAGSVGLWCDCSPGRA